MFKCIVIVLIVFLVLLLINGDSCENYSGLDMKGNVIPCYEAIKYDVLDQGREYNPNNVQYDDVTNEPEYNFSNENVPLTNSVLPMPSM